MIVIVQLRSDDFKNGDNRLLRIILNLKIDFFSNIFIEIMRITVSGRLKERRRSKDLLLNFAFTLIDLSK